MVVKKVESKLLWDLVVFEADHYEECLMGSFFGTRRYWVNKGTRVRLRMPKRWCLEPKDQVPLSKLVMHVDSGSDVFSWCYTLY